MRSFPFTVLVRSVAAMPLGSPTYTPSLKDEQHAPLVLPIPVGLLLTPFLMLE